MTQREEFEKWASEPPMEWCLARYPDDEVRFAWPGLYKDYTVQSAWEAWQEAAKRATK